MGFRARNSVRKAADRVRITAQLIEAGGWSKLKLTQSLRKADGSHLGFADYPHQ